LLDVELDYRRKLEDIQRSFEEGADEAARKNDAVAMARLIRQKNNEMKEADVARERRVEDEEKSYAMELAELKASHEERRKEINEDAAIRLEEMEASLEEQLVAAEGARQKDIENLERSLARQKEDLERHRRWDDEDRAEKWAKEAQGLAMHLSSLDTLDKSHLESLLAQHGQYITDDLALWDSYYAARSKKAAGAAASAYTRGPGYTADDSSGRDPGSPYSRRQMEQWGFATGGIGLAMNPQSVNVAENGPEMVAALPLSNIVQHDVNFSGMDVNFNGISRQTEAELKPIMMEAMQSLALQLKSALLSGAQR
jgi:hypothetical protein